MYKCGEFLHKGIDDLYVQWALQSNVLPHVNYNPGKEMGYCNNSIFSIIPLCSISTVAAKTDQRQNSRHHYNSGLYYKIATSFLRRHVGLCR